MPFDAGQGAVRPLRLLIHSMMPEVSHEAQIYIVGSDDAVRDSLKVLLEAYGFAVASFESDLAFWRSDRPHTGACLILDLRYGETGLPFLLSSEAVQPVAPMIVLADESGEAAAAVRRWQPAPICLAKPFAAEALLAAIDAAIDKNQDLAETHGLNGSPEKGEIR